MRRARLRLAIFDRLSRLADRVARRLEIALDDAYAVVHPPEPPCRCVSRQHTCGHPDGWNDA